MARPQSRFVCQSCGETFLRWEGQCRACDGWNTLVETVVREPSRVERAGLRAATAGVAAPPVGLAAIADADLPRLPLGIDELDRVLGGGLVPGSLVLVGGEPGIGKSTLLLQAAAGLTRGGLGVLYATGEESPGQVRLRAARLGLLAGSSADGVRVLAEHDVGRIVEAARAERPGLVVVDSVQTATVDELEGAAGSVGQVRESTLRLMELAKGDGIAVILVGPRDQGRLDRRAEDPRAPGRRRPQPRGRAVRGPAAPPSDQEQVRLDGRGRRLRDGRDRHARGRRPGPRFPRRPRRVGARKRRRADARGQPAAAGRGPGIGQPDRLREPVAQGERPRPQSPQPADRGPRQARRDRPRQS